MSPVRRAAAVLLLAGLATTGFAGASPLDPPPDLIFAGGFEAQAARLLTVTNAGGGTVTSVPAGIDCGATCSALFPDGAGVSLQARTSNGSGFSFTGWSGDCGGSLRDCALVLGADGSATAVFTNQPYNLVFVSSAAFASTLGSAEAYDAQCNALATAAGINNAAGDAYVAWVSSFTTSAASRLGAARGWVRLDGAPFADQLSSLTSAGQVFNPIDHDEFGAPAPSQQVLTGTLPSGGLGAASCGSWSTTGGPHNSGYSSGGPIAWTQIGYASCAIPAPIYCLMKTQSVSLSPAVNPGRKIWITSAAYMPGAAITPDQACDAERPAGVASAKAVIATTATAAAAALSADATYVRIDGQVVGTGAELALAKLRSGIWQTANGNYLNGNAAFTWTGDASDLSAAGTSAGTCSDWTATSGSGAYGIPQTDDARWWNFATHACTDVSTRLICAEQ